jgi:hypothetical protein
MIFGFVNRVRRIAATGLIVAASAATPGIAIAQTGPGAGRPGGGMGAQRPSQPISRPPGGGSSANRPPNGSPARPVAPPPNYYRPAGSNTHGYYAGYRGARVVVVNPVYHRYSPWHWNRGVIWYPVGSYWGGGFWGPYAIGVTTAIVFGAALNAASQPITSYKVAPNSPGATLLTNYQLTQTPCGPQGLVVIFGPDDSVICTHPNHLVHAGTYDLDAQQLSIVSR